MAPCHAARYPLELCRGDLLAADEQAIQAIQRLETEPQLQVQIQLQGLGFLLKIPAYLFELRPIQMPAAKQREQNAEQRDQNGGTLVDGHHCEAYFPFLLQQG